MMRILPALFYSTTESYDAEFLSPKPRLSGLSMKIHDTKLKIKLPLLNHEWCSVGTNDKPKMEGSWIKIWARDSDWTGTFMFSTKKTGRRTADWAVENPFLEDGMVINDHNLMEITVNLKVPNDFKGAVPKFLIYACGTGGRYPFRSIWKSPHGKYRGAIALTIPSVEEPCVMLDCLPFQTIANTDENGCGGECVSVKCTEMGCEQGEGDCDDDSHCVEGLKCGRNNCDESKGFGPKDDCCYDESLEDACGGKDCCTKDKPCYEGMGDCQDDSHCAEGLKCGVNNCNQADGYHPKDDCCFDPSETGTVQECNGDETKMEDCNMCKCVSGSWACTRKACIEKGHTKSKNWMKMITITKHIKLSLPMGDNKWCAAGTNDKEVMDGSWTKIWPRDSKWSGNFIWSTLTDGKRKPEKAKKNPWLPAGMVIEDNTMELVISLKPVNKVPVPRYILYACGKGSRYSYKNTGEAPHGMYRGAIDLESSEHIN